MLVLKSWTIAIVGHIVITKRHLKIIPSMFGAIFRRKKYHKWPDGTYITVAPKLLSVRYAPIIVMPHLPQVGPGRGFCKA